MDSITDLVAQLRELGCAVVVSKPDEHTDLISRAELTIMLNREKDRIINQRRQDKYEVWWAGQHH